MDKRFLHMRTILGGFIVLVALSTPARALTLTNFRDCIGANTHSYGTTCELDAGTYSIGASEPTLVITRTGIVVTGTVNSSIYDTTLQRVCPTGKTPPCDYTDGTVQALMRVGDPSHQSG
ncbi:MAG: hypothetical protein JO062_28085 [Bryobacterales bacterium]|nr:hypothetical protein [Bryobacterales bacterium]